MAGVKGKSGRKPGKVQRKGYGVTLAPTEAEKVDRLVEQKEWSAAKVIEKLIIAGIKSGGLK